MSFSRVDARSSIALAPFASCLIFDQEKFIEIQADFFNESPSSPQRTYCVIRYPNDELRTIRAESIFLKGERSFKNLSCSCQKSIVQSVPKERFAILKQTVQFSNLKNVDDITNSPVRNPLK